MISRSYIFMLLPQKQHQCKESTSIPANMELTLGDRTVDPCMTRPCWVCCGWCACGWDRYYPVIFAPPRLYSAPRVGSFGRDSRQKSASHEERHGAGGLLETMPIRCGSPRPREVFHFLVAYIACCRVYAVSCARGPAESLI